ncbi:MAG: RloB family protein [bacterium]|nr:RloB family protein [bacterium]
MGLTSRRKRPLDRTIPHLRDTRLIIIAAEGNKTEKQYFESGLFHDHRVQVKVLNSDDNRSAPNHVFNRLKRYAVEVEWQPGDQLWLMVDKDRWPEKLLSEVCSCAVRGRKFKINLALSNPSFELWLYLHHSDWTSGTVSSRDMEKELKSLLGGYNKSNINIDKFRHGIAAAVRRARDMDTQPEGRWPSNPGTHVYRVMMEIEGIKLRALAAAGSLHADITDLSTRHDKYLEEIYSE